MLLHETGRNNNKRIPKHACDFYLPQSCWFPTACVVEADFSDGADLMVVWCQCADNVGIWEKERQREKVSEVVLARDLGTVWGVSVRRKRETEWHCEEVKAPPAPSTLSVSQRRSRGDEEGTREWERWPCEIKERKKKKNNNQFKDSLKRTVLVIF